MIQLKPNQELDWALDFNLPGPVQTVARGELYVLVFLAQRLDPLASVTYVTDNQNVYKTYYKGKTAALKSTNCDLFRLLFEQIEKHSLTIHVRWMPSHLKPEDPRPVGVSERDVAGNSLADHYAGVAATRLKVPLNVSTPCVYYYSLVRKIQRRLIDIIINLPHRHKTRVPTMATPMRITLEDLFSPRNMLSF